MTPSDFPNIRTVGAGILMGVGVEVCIRYRHLHNLDQEKYFRFTINIGLFEKLRETEFRTYQNWSKIFMQMAIFTFLLQHLREFSTLGTELIFS